MLEKGFSKVKRLYQINATHRRGWRMLEVSNKDICRNILEESAEVLNAGVRGDFKRSDLVEEIADLQAAVLHLMLHNGIKAEEVDCKMVEKLERRFNV